jgi:cGMP-dependent protein kinase
MTLEAGQYFGESSIGATESDVAPTRLANVVAVGACQLGRMMATDLLSRCGPLKDIIELEFNRKAIAPVSLLTDVLTPSELQAVLRRLIEVVVPSGHEIVRQGTTASNFYIIKAGSVDVLEDGQKVSTLGQGDSFGEQALLMAEPTDQTVVASTSTTVCHALAITHPGQHHPNPVNPSHPTNELPEHQLCLPSACSHPERRASEPVLLVCPLHS